MTRQDLNDQFGAGWVPVMRFCHRIYLANQERMFAGNHNCRRALLDAGFILVVGRTGQWWRLAVTDKGLEALGVANAS